ncbi:signal recognition particle subunit SRP72-like [Branchiostoma floridae x Branchiostoma japonicum]
MAAPDGQPNLSQLFSDLNRAGQAGDFNKALKIATKILKQDPHDEKAYHCKVVSMIQLGQFNEVIRFMGGNYKLSDPLKFERAYCLYRLNRTQEALEVIKKIPEPDYRIKELLGQVLYRLEKHDECLELYRDLIRNSQDEFDEERETNLAAVVAAAQMWGGKELEDYGLRESTYELSYNAACSQLSKGNVKGAEEKLQKAEELCRQNLEEDPEVTEEDIEAELGVLKTQRAYCLQLQGQNEEATKIYNQVLKSRPTDVGLTAVASNNIISLNKDQNVFDSKKKIKSATAEGVDQKLTKQQLRDIAFNKCLLQMYTNQNEACRKLAKSLQEEYPDQDMPLLIQAAQLCREKHRQKAVELLCDHINNRPNPSITMKLTLAQLHLNQGNAGQAAEVLQSVGELRYKPNMVSTLVNLYSSMENIEGAAEVLDTTVNWYKENHPSSPYLAQLMRASSQFKLKHGQAQKATEILEELRSMNPDDVKTIAQLISAYSQCDPKKGEEISKELPPLDPSFFSGLDIEALEKAAMTMGTRKKAAKAAAGTAGGDKADSPVEETKDSVIVQKKKRRKKKGKLPKNHDPSVTPDPERWLPIRERSYFKGRRKRKQKDGVGKGTQGATAGAASDLDASKPQVTPSSPRAGASGSSQSAPTGASGTAQPEMVGPRQQKPQASSKKSKKKKGGGKNKW